MQKHTLKAEKRTITGKKVKNLRGTGILPANIYGKKIKSQAAQVDLKEFQKVYQEVGETGLVDLVLDKEETRPILIHNIQVSPVTDLPLHADFYQVSLKEKISAMVPIALIGASPIIENKEGVLLTILDEVEVEALPTDLPEKIELDIKALTAVDQELKVKDLKVDTNKITVKSDSNLTLIKVGPLITKEIKKEVEAEEKAKAAAAPAEGATPSETKPPAAPSPATKEEAKPAKKEESPPKKNK